MGREGDKIIRCIGIALRSTYR